MSSIDGSALAYPPGRTLPELRVPPCLRVLRVEVFPSDFRVFALSPFHDLKQSESAVSRSRRGSPRPDVAHTPEKPAEGRPRLPGPPRRRRTPGTESRPARSASLRAHTSVGSAPPPPPAATRAAPRRP